MIPAASGAPAPDEHREPSPAASRRLLSHEAPWLQAWADLEFEVDDVLDAGHDVVALIRNQRQWGRRSGIVTEMPPYGVVFTIRNGKVVRWRAFSDERSALKAAGLRDSAIADVARPGMGRPGFEPGTDGL